MASEAQQNASRINGAQSHGALSPETKAICAQNATKHALTATKIIIAEQDREEYDRLVTISFSHYRPVSEMEKHLVQSIADLEWKLVKADIYESGILAGARLQNQDTVVNTENPADRQTIIEGIIYVANAKGLQNLTLQRSRVQRDLERRIKQFEAARADREVIEVSQVDIAIGSMKRGGPLHPSVGVLFSRQYLMARMQFEEVAAKEKIAVFDRSWPDKSLQQRA